MYFKKPLTFSPIIILLLFFLSCEENKVEIKKKENLNIIYLILDKSSNSFSSDGGIEENFIEVDTQYLSSFLNNLYWNEKRSRNNMTTVLFFNYIDINAKGNKELFLKLPSIPIIDSIYIPKSGQIVSSKEEFMKNVKKKKIELQQQHKSFNNKVSSLLSKIEVMLKKSKKTKGSDCSGTLLIADSKLDNYAVDTVTYRINKKLIFAFSDLVNFPKNNRKIELRNKVIRPGYTSQVPFINGNSLVNITTQEEFEEFIETIQTIK